MQARGCVLTRTAGLTCLCSFHRDLRLAHGLQPVPGGRLVELNENLVGPMVHGDKALELDATPSRDDAGSRLLAGAILAACAMLVAWLVKQAG